MKTTPQHFKQFKKYCQKYILKYSLKAWNWHFYHADVWEDNKNLTGILIRKDQDKHVNVYLNPDWGEEKPTTVKLDKAALHEIYHVILYPLAELSAKRYSDDVVNSIEHDIINRLINA